VTEWASTSGRIDGTYRVPDRLEGRGPSWLSDQPPISHRGTPTPASASRKNAAPFGSYREPTDNEQDGGWRFFGGDEDQAYTDTPDNIGLYAVGTIAEIDPSVVPLLHTEPPCAFERATPQQPSGPARMSISPLRRRSDEGSCPRSESRTPFYTCRRRGARNTSCRTSHSPAHVGRCCWCSRIKRTPAAIASSWDFAASTA
jgi:hypothetical protein